MKIVQSTEHDLTWQPTENDAVELKIHIDADRDAKLFLKPQNAESSAYRYLGYTELVALRSLITKALKLVRR